MNHAFMLKYYAQARMKAMAKRWRTEANRLALRIRKCEYFDQTSRVIMSTEIRSLRRCAKALERLSKSL